MRKMKGTTNSHEAVLSVDVQYAAEEKQGRRLPTSEQISIWANNAYQSIYDKATEVTIRFVDRTEMIALNRDYRGKQGATNVLSFSFELDPEINIALLGDVVICHAVVVAEAVEQKKKLEHHYAHLITHGILHLCGYDHVDHQDAREMEALEISLLEKHGIGNPPYSH